MKKAIVKDFFYFQGYLIKIGFLHEKHKFNLW